MKENMELMKAKLKLMSEDEDIELIIDEDGD